LYGIHALVADLMRQVALQVVAVRGAAQEEATLQPELRAGGGSLAAVVRLDARAPDDHVAFTAQRVGEEEFVVAGLVAPEQHAGAVVALDQDAADTDPRGEARRLVERRGQVG
jgi:hypothetical protein